MMPPPTEFLFIVDRATGYVIVIPAALKGLDARKLAELCFQNSLFFTGVPSKEGPYQDRPPLFPFCLLPC